MSLIASVSNISRGSLHDGPGVRTVIYFKGCGLRCRWCHNPETLSFETDILYAPIKCIHCGKCVSICPQHHVIQGNDMVFLRDGCAKCGKCVSACPSGALSASGEKKTLESVWKEIEKDIHFYQVSGGGVTLSGGECLLQAEFCAALLEKCREKGVHTAIESALFVPWGSLEQVLPFCDLFLCDMKIADPDKHRLYTGQDNRLILENFRQLTQRAPGRVLLRTPLIPGVNDSEEDMRLMADAIRDFAHNLKGIELLKYNALAESKYMLAGMEYERFGEEAQSNEQVAALCAVLKQSLGNIDAYFS